MLSAVGAKHSDCRLPTALAAVYECLRFHDVSRHTSRLGLQEPDSKGGQYSIFSTVTTWTYLASLASSPMKRPADVLRDRQNSGTKCRHLRTGGDSPADHRLPHEATKFSLHLYIIRTGFKAHLPAPDEDRRTRFPRRVRGSAVLRTLAAPTKRSTRHNDRRTGAGNS